MSKNEQKGYDEPILDADDTLKVTIGTRESKSEGVSVKKVAATTAALVALALIGGDKGPQTPRPVAARKADEESCELPAGETYPTATEIFGVDGKRVRDGRYNFLEMCKFLEEKSGYTVIEGFEALNEEGDLRRCFLTPSWMPDTLLQIAGQVEGSNQMPGVLHLRDGLVDVKTGVDVTHSVGEESAATESAEVLVGGKAPLAITTTGRASVILLPEKIGADGKVENFVRVTAQEGETIIAQQGRDDLIVLKGCEYTEIPLNVEQPRLNCFIAEGKPGAGGFSHDKGALVIGAGALFLALVRRRKRSAKVKAVPW